MARNKIYDNVKFCGANSDKKEITDKDRLDWLDKNMREDAMTHDYVVIRPVQKWQTLRSAIDLAMSKETKQP